MKYHGKYSIGCCITDGTHQRIANHKICIFHRPNCIIWKTLHFIAICVVYTLDNYAICSGHDQYEPVISL